MFWMIKPKLIDLAVTVELAVSKNIVIVEKYKENVRQFVDARIVIITKFFCQKNKFIKSTNHFLEKNTN